MSKPPAKRVELRTVARDAIRAEVANHAVDLFLEKGFDETTVDDICSSAGISPRTFFRYFASKEQVVVGDAQESGRALVSVIECRPSDEDPWTSMERGLQTLFAFSDDDRMRRFFQTMAVICESSTLRASHLEKHLVWAHLLVPVLVGREGDERAGRRLRMRAIVHSALACLDAALMEWVEQSGNEALPGLLRDAFAVHEHPASP